jgi:hypothetical protein
MNDKIWRQLASRIEAEVDGFANERLDGAGGVEEPVVQQHSRQPNDGACDTLKCSLRY